MTADHYLFLSGFFGLPVFTVVMAYAIFTHGLLHGMALDLLPSLLAAVVAGIAWPFLCAGAAIVYANVLLRKPAALPAMEPLVLEPETDNPAPRAEVLYF